MKIYTPIEFSPSQQAELRAQVGTHEIVFGSKSETDREKFAGAQIVFGSVPGAWLAESDHVRWVQLDSTGFSHYRHLDWATLSQRIVVTNLPGFFAEPAAETAIAGLLGLLRGIDKLVLLQAQRRWNSLPVRLNLGSLHRASVLIAGYGQIGKRIAALLAPYDCRITPFAPNSPDAVIHTSAELDATLPTQDIVIAAMPETPATIGLFDATRLARFKRGAIFVNIGRGSCVDETALVNRLNDESIGGAVLDVTAKEPLPADHLLWSAPNCILTQHSGGGTKDEHEKKPPFFLENLKRFEAKLPLVGLVNWSRGY